MITRNFDILTQFDWNIAFENASLYLVRHASPSSNYTGSYLHDTGPGLSEEGFREAAQLAVKLHEISLPASIVRTSSMRRAVETAKIVCPAFAGEICIDPHLNEFDFQQPINFRTLEEISLSIYESTNLGCPIWVTHGAVIYSVIVGLCKITPTRLTKYGNCCPPTGVWHIKCSKGRWAANYVFGPESNSYDPFIAYTNQTK